MLSSLKTLIPGLRIPAAITLAIAAIAAITLAPTTSHARLSCERSTSVCNDSTTHIVNGVAIGAPTILNAQACWSWSNTYSCVETNATYSCTGGGAQVGKVMSACSVVSGVIASSVTIRGKQYPLSATAQYACDFEKFVLTTPIPPAPTGNFVMKPPLPPAPKECVRLEAVVTDKNIVSSSAIGATPTSGSGTASATTAVLETTLAMSRYRRDEFVCYDKPVETCVDTCYAGSGVSTTGGGASTIAVAPVACAAPLNKANCSVQSQACDGSRDAAVVDSGRLEQGPDGRCVAGTTSYLCPSATAPSCMNEPNCTLVESKWAVVSTNGVPLTMDQTYECSKTETKCERISSVNSCNSTQTWGLDNMTLESPLGLGLNEANSAMAKVEGIQKGMTESDVYIFSGQDLRCRYPVGSWLNAFVAIAFSLALAAMTGGASLGMMIGLTTGQSLAIGAALSIAGDAPNTKAFGTNCCKDYIIEGSDAWYKTGKCTPDEIKLSVARSKHLAIRIGGDYCSKKSGFPFKECKEMTRTFCAFDDMLALTVNEQGRAQLDRLASASTGNTTSSPNVAFQMFGAATSPNPGHLYLGLDTGAWSEVTNVAGSKIYSWKYPAYCKSPAAQSYAFAAHQQEVNDIVSMAGFIPPKDANGKYLLENLTQAQKTAVAARLLTVPSFQGCASMPGSLPFMTCAVATCDVTKMPATAEGAEFSELGELKTNEADPNWRVQAVRSFYAPGDYGVTRTMSTNASFARVSNSLSENISANGSCKEATGACLFDFDVTTGGSGAKRRLKESVRFPLYSLNASPEYPTINYMPLDGTLPSAGYAADRNKGLATPLTMSKQRYIFHPILMTQAPATGIHPAVLLEWAFQAGVKGEPGSDYQALALPTDLPKNTPGWWPVDAFRVYQTSYKDDTSNWIRRWICGWQSNGWPHTVYSEAQMQAIWGFTCTTTTYVPVQFFISGGCDKDSKWCEYTLEQDLQIDRHPWGSAQSPRCWGFSIDQMAVLDFDAMDLSRWINSLDLDGMVAGMPDASKTAMAGQVTASAQTFYTAMSSGAETSTTAAEAQVLLLSNDTLPTMSGPPFEAYKLHIAVPSNWPKVYATGAGTNDNPITNAIVDFGRPGINTDTLLLKHSSGKYLEATNDMGDYPVGTYKVTVRLQTAKNGEQVLSQYVRITPYYGKAPSDKTLDFGNSNINAPTSAKYTPAELANGSKQTSTGVTKPDGTVVSPGLAPLYNKQGTTVTPVPTTPGTL